MNFLERISNISDEDYNQLSLSLQILNEYIESKKQVGVSDIKLFVELSTWLQNDYAHSYEHHSSSSITIDSTLSKHTKEYQSNLNEINDEKKKLQDNIRKVLRQHTQELEAQKNENAEAIEKKGMLALGHKKENILNNIKDSDDKYLKRAEKIRGFNWQNLILPASSKRKQELQNNLDATHSFFDILDIQNKKYTDTILALKQEFSSIDNEIKEKIQDYTKTSNQELSILDTQFAEKIALLKMNFEKAQKELETATKEKIEMYNALQESVFQTYKDNFKDATEIAFKKFNLAKSDSDIFKLFDDISLNTLAIDKLRKSSNEEYINVGSITYDVNDFIDNTHLFLPLIHSNNVIFQYSTEEGKQKLSNLLTSIVFKEALTLPDGKIKLTLVDPIGAGGNCSPLLGLDKLFYENVYTDERDIEDELSKLTKFIAYVNTKYLKNQYKSIKEYNLGIGDVEEPYQILVAYDTLDSFKNNSLEKVKIIMQNSTRTGIQTLFIQKVEIEHKDEYEKKEKDKILKELLDMSIVITEHGSGFKVTMPKNFSDETFQNYLNGHISLETQDNQILHEKVQSYLNKKLSSVDDLKVSYMDKVKPILDTNKFWTKSASSEIEASIGKAGREDQLLKINNKIEAHALLIGRSGSGKSNLLHMIITDLALNYAPSELRMYLIDMKGGIEFIRYVNNALPHVEVTSITSDREMAHSVISGLELELQKREELFSSASIQNIADYNKKFPKKIIPRVLLVLDEFQELFSKEDSIKRSAMEIFERLSKKGRSFGINMILASQSLGGETLPSTTIAQLAIRMVLQCSEDDSRKALSASNEDAKLLTRPGEGIYNSKNGQTNGNERFQTYWMEDNEDEAILKAISDYAEAQNSDIPTRVFREDKRPSFEEYSKQTVCTQHSLSIAIGQPYSLEEGVSLEFKQESGSNIVVSGIQERLALNIFISLLTSLALESTKKRTFYLFDTTAQNHPDYGVMKKYIEILEDYEFDVITLTNKTVLQELQSINDEIQAAQNSGTPITEEKYLFMFGLDKARNFKKPDYNLSDEAMALSKILADGGEHGIHTTIYVSNSKALDNIFENGTIKNDLETLIALQMSVDDSRRLIGTDNAGTLGKENAILYVENMNLMKKFRPLQLPNEAWLNRQLDQL